VRAATPHHPRRCGSRRAPPPPRFPPRPSLHRAHRRVIMSGRVWERLPTRPGPGKFHFARQAATSEIIYRISLRATAQLRRLRCRLAHLFHTSLGDRTPTHCGLWPCRELAGLKSVRGAVATNQPSSGRLQCSRLGLRREQKNVAHCTAISTPLVDPVPVGLPSAQWRFARVRQARAASSRAVQQAAVVRHRVLHKSSSGTMLRQTSLNV